MVPLAGIGLEVLLVLVGIAFFLMIGVFLRAAPRLDAWSPAPGTGEVDLAADARPEAVLLIRPGGRILAMNAAARASFNLLDNETPNLERLARRTHDNPDFLRLCAEEGAARFSLDGRLVEGVSYRVPGNPEALMLVSLRQPELAPELGSSAQTLHTFTELGQSMTASLDVETTLQAVLENVERLLPADFMEITLWQASDESLAPYHLSGLPGEERRLEKAEEHYRAGEGYSGFLARERAPLLIPDVAGRTDLRPAGNNPQAHLLKSYLGVPLLAGKELIGTLELGARQADAFQPGDLELVRLLSGQAAVALHNALLFAAEQRRSLELSGLSQLAQAIGSLQDPKDVFERLVHSIAPLVDTEILGFLIYNEAQRRLEGQNPFLGMPPQFIELYHAPVPPNSPAEQDSAFSRGPDRRKRRRGRPVGRPGAGAPGAGRQPA